jgi:hypothetical protein
MEQGDMVGLLSLVVVEQRVEAQQPVIMVVLMVVEAAVLIPLMIRIGMVVLVLRVFCIALNF